MNQFNCQPLINIALIGIIILFGCQKTEDVREIFIKPIDPLTQQSELSRILEIDGTNHEGNAPESNTLDLLKITNAPLTATITSNNNLFIPFVYESQATLKGVYLQISGADNYWDIPANNPNGSTYVLNVGVPPQVLTGAFDVIYRPYDTDGNIAEHITLVTTIVPKEDRCGNGQGFPRVQGNDGIVNKKYDLGDQRGTVSITYNMFTVKDRMDIRYGEQWILSTDDQLLRGNEAPPIKRCSEATAADGFVSGSHTFQFEYDPNVSREVDVYISGCLEGGTAWYFDVSCPSGTSGPPPPTAKWYDELPDCPCTYDEAVGRTTDPLGQWLACGAPYNDHYHYGASFEARWVPENAPDAVGQQCTYDAQGRLITAGIAAGSPDMDSPDNCGNEMGALPDPGHLKKDVYTWEYCPCLEYLEKWPANNGNGCFQNPISDIQHMRKLVGNMNCDDVVDLFKAVDRTPNSPTLLQNYFHQQISLTPLELIPLLESLQDELNCVFSPDQCGSITQAIKNLQTP